MTIISSLHDFDVRILINCPLLYLLHIYNPSVHIYKHKRHAIPLVNNQQHIHHPQHTFSTRITQTAISKAIKTRIQYLLEYQIFAICFLCLCITYFAFNPYLFFYLRLHFAHQSLTSEYASFMFAIFYTSCIISILFWMIISRLKLWNIHPRLNTDEIDDQENNNLANNSLHNRINGYIMCLRWMIFGFIVCLSLLSVISTIDHILILMGILGFFYPNLLITSSSLLLYQMKKMPNVEYIHYFFAGLYFICMYFSLVSEFAMVCITFLCILIKVCIISGWTIFPLITALMAIYIKYYAPWIFWSAILLIALLFSLFAKPSKATIDLIINSGRREYISPEISTINETTALKSDVHRENYSGVDEQQNEDVGNSSSSSIFTRIPVSDIESLDEQTDISDEQRVATVVNDVNGCQVGGCQRTCDWDEGIMSSSMGIFQISTFFLNIQSFCINIVLALYLTWYPTIMYDAFGQPFIISSLQMMITGLVVIFCSTFVSSLIWKWYNFYGFQLWMSLLSIGLSLVNIQIGSSFNAWFLTPITLGCISILILCTNLIFIRNTPNGCLTFVNGSHQIFQLSAFAIGPLLMGIVNNFGKKSDDVLYYFWMAIIIALVIQFVICFICYFVQLFAICCGKFLKMQSVRKEYHVEYARPLFRGMIDSAMSVGKRSVGRNSKASAGSHVSDVELEGDDDDVEVLQSVK